MNRLSPETAVRVFEETLPTGGKPLQVFTEEEHSLEDLEKRYIQFVLRRTKGHRQDAARILGINRKTLGNKIEKYNLKVD